MEISLMIALGAGTWLWFNSIGARETAIRRGRELAERCSLQLLDETVACTKLRFGRNRRGHLQFMRIYDFEVSANGSDRLPCQLVLLGHELQSWHIPPYLQPVH
jgi:hypothetical protein